jgi:hypothetical protein
VEDPRVVLQPVGQVVDAVVAHPGVPGQGQAPQEVEVLQHAVLEVLQAVVGQVQLAQVEQAREGRWSRGRVEGRRRERVGDETRENGKGGF